MIGYIIKKEGANIYYTGSSRSNYGLHHSLHGAKIYKYLKFAKLALNEALKYDTNFKIYEVEITLKDEVKE
jgi:hypothetical protein